MKNFCTLSDAKFLPFGLSLYKSLKENVTGEFRLFYLCTDEECCTDTDWELYGGIFCCCAFFIAFIVGILYLFS